MNKLSTHNLIVAIDDLHPETGWGLPDDECVSYLRLLNEEFGCKFTFFIPANWHNKWKISDHVDWIQYWNNQDWVELAAHGNLHICNNSERYGQCEFWEITDYNIAEDRILNALDMWNQCGIRPRGWRNPGWEASVESVKAISKHFDYAAIHGNDKNTYDLKTFVGEDGIHASDSIRLWDGAFMFQSHINGEWNDNQWTRKNYEQFRATLTFLISEYNINFKTIIEIYDELHKN